MPKKVVAYIENLRSYLTEKLEREFSFEDAFEVFLQLATAKLTEIIATKQLTEFKKAKEKELKL